MRARRGAVAGGQLHLDQPPQSGLPPWQTESRQLRQPLVQGNRFGVAASVREVRGTFQDIRVVG